MRQVLKYHRAILMCTAVGLLIYAASSGFGGFFATATAQTKESTPAKAKDEAKAAPQAAAALKLIPPPADVNELSMEVAALRTLYLLKAGPDQNEEYNSYDGIKNFLKDKEIPQPPRDRLAKVSKNYLKVLTDLREAFITNNEDRISELSDQIEELTSSESPELDDAIDLTPKSRGAAIGFLRGYMDARRIATYISAYGKEFPDPKGLILKNTRDTLGVWPPKAVWKDTRDFVAKEVGFAYAGLNEKLQEEIAVKVGELLDRAYGMTPAQLLKEFSTPSSGLRSQLNGICNPYGPTDVIKHVLERDVAELLSNPRLGAAIKARVEYLKKK
jgi:hypothetical protein